MRSLDTLADDLAVLDAIRAGWCFAGTITNNTALGYREVDRALQRLRKSGQVVYDRRTGWSLATK